MQIWIADYRDAAFLIRALLFFVLALQNCAAAWNSDQDEMKGNSLAAIALVGSCLCGSVWAAEANTDSLLDTGQWRDASRSLFVEAQRLDPVQYELPAAQARAGFVAAALGSVEVSPVWAHPAGYLEVARQAPGLSDSQRMQLLQRALSDARLSEAGRLELVNISLAFLRLGHEDAARQAYSEAWTNAQSSPGGYRHMVDSLEMEADLSLRTWMLDPMVLALDQMSEAEDIAHVSAGLATLEARTGEQQVAIHTLQTGFAAAQRIPKGSAKRIANNRLARVAIRLGDLDSARQYGSDNDLAPDYAMHEAELGHYQEALAIIAELNANLYVDHRGETLDAVISSAIKRGDLKGAGIFMAELPVDNHWANAKASIQLAEADLSSGNREGAQAAYEAAWNHLLQASQEEVYVQNIRFMAGLARSLKRAGLSERAAAVVAALQPSIARINPRREKDLIQAEITAAGLYAELHDFDHASTLFHSAYQHSVATGETAPGSRAATSRAEGFVLLAAALAEAGSAQP